MTEPNPDLPKHYPEADVPIPPDERNDRDMGRDDGDVPLIGDPAAGHWPTPWPDIDSSLMNAVGELSDADVGGATEGTLEDLARRLAQTGAILKVAHELWEGLQLALAESMEADVMVVPSVGRLHRESHKRTTWADGDSAERLRSDLIRSTADVVALDPATGERDPIKRNIAAYAAQTLLAAIPQVSNVLANGRRQLGIDISEYRATITSYRVSLDPGVAE